MSARRWRSRRGTAPAGRLADSDAATVRRIGWQLAALLVGLLCLLLFSLLGVLYYRTQSEALATIHSALRTRAESELSHLTDRVSRSGQQLALRELPREEQERGEIFIVFAGARLQILGGVAGPFGRALADRAAAAAALRTGQPRFTTRQLGTAPSYVIFSDPVFRAGRALGVVQTGMSARPYEASIRVLLQSLLLASALGLVAAAGITALVVQRALAPIRAALGRQRDFVADAAHELRTPLTIVRTAAELWLDPGSEGDQEAAVEQVLAQTAHLARLVDDLSLLARADSGAVGMEIGCVDLAALVREMAEAMVLVAEERDILLAASAAEVQVWGDASRLRQLVLILLDNAVKHTPPGGSVAVRLGQHQGQALLQVRDTGPGIAPGDLPHLFDRFYRADRARSGESAGLGLAIARWVVQAHQGQLRAANAPGGGALFSVALPVRKQQE